MIGFGVGEYAARKKPSAESLTPDEQESMLSALARNTGGAVEQIGLLLDTPGAIARGIMAGDPGSGFNWDYDKRTSGEELLKSYGLLDKDADSWGSTAVGIGAEIITDPLALVTTPLSSLTKAGKAAKAANLLDLAPIAAQQRMGNAAKRTMTGRLAESALEDLLPQGLAKTPENYAIRPLVGPRVARTTTTLDEVVQAAPDPTKALDDLTKYLDTKGLTYDAVKDEKLGGAFGLGLFSPAVTFTPPGSGAVLDAMDALGQAVAWSYPARLASSAFDERVGGMIDSGDQIAALRQFNALDQARASGRRMAQAHAETVASIPMSSRAKSLLGADSLLSEQGNDLLTRLFEGKATASDRILMRELPGIDRAVASWDRIRNFNASEASRLGIDFTPLRDPKFGVEYSPRAGTELDFGEYGTGFGRSMFQARTNEQLNRNAHLFTPGGTVDLREVSRLPIVRQWARDGSRSQFSVAQVGSEIANYLNRKHGYRAIDQAHGEGMARVMYRINKDLPDNIPAFAGHPLNEQTRAIISQEVMRANANYVYDSLAEAAAGAAANQIPGGGFKPLVSAANEIAGRVGLKTTSGGLDPAVQKQLVDRVAARLGVNPSQVDITQLSVPEEVYNRLSRINDFYSSPRVQQEVSGMLDSMTQFWKASILAFPARHSRDIFSNAVSVWLETGDPLATTQGFGIAKRVLSGNIDAVLPQLQNLPQYRGLAPAAAKSKFMGDVAASGVLTGLSQADVLAARRQGELSKIMPGVTPITRGRAFAQLIPDGSRTPLQMLYDQTQVRGLTNQFETRNALFNWSQQLSDANDSIARLGGFIALLSKGVNPEQAASRILNVLVNYDSLTTFERGFMRKIFPWWSYTSRIGKYAVQSMMQNPGGSMAQMIRMSNVMGQSTDDNYVPERLRQQLSIGVPDDALRALGIELAPGDQLRFSDFDLPAMDALATFSGGPQDIISNLLGQSNPFIKSIGEIAFDTDLFTKRRLADADPAINKIYRRLSGGGELSNIAKVLGSNIPGTQRLIGLAGGLMDDRLDPGEAGVKTAISSLIGPKPVLVDQKWRDADAYRQLLKQMAPYSGSFTMQYIDKDKIATASPEEQKLAELAKLLQQRRREQNAAKKKAPIPLPYVGLEP